MRPFKRPPTLLSQCSQCLHRTISTTAKATSKRRRERNAQREIDLDLRQRAFDLRERIRNARVASREDWLLGPLAPYRDTGNDEYGTVSARDVRGVKGGLARGGVSPFGKKGTKATRGGMSWEESLLYEGDRVAIVSRTGLESRDLGKIGTVLEVRKDEREVLIDDLNLADIKVPASALAIEPEIPRIRSVPIPIPFSSVRLVQAIRDPRTRIVEDKIISRVIALPEERKMAIHAEFAAGVIDEKEKEDKLNARAIPGSKDVYGDWLEIPLPKAGEEKEKPEVKEHESDTVRFEVEEKSWTPTLLRAPMPGSVIDELRNKYSRFRTRHDAGYQLALDNRARRKADYKAWVESGGGMTMTPTKEARRRESRKLKERGEPTLEKEVLERIGEVMAKQGIEMTGKRRREVERNLRKEGVVKWGSDVEIPGKEKAEAAVLEKENEDGEWEEAEEEEEEDEGREEVQDAVIEEDRGSEKRPPAS